MGSSARGRLRLGTGASIFAVVGAVSAVAQIPPSSTHSVDALPTEQSASPDASAQQAQDIVVTASRIPTGFTAPTPTTVLGTQQIQATAPIQITDALELIPAFRSAGVSSSAARYANLRSIGSSRTLVLIDGRRHVPTAADGTFDLNLIPANLVARTEVVTGGASASWGSDAVAGVVNLILRTDFEGLEVSGQSGISNYGDSFNYSGSFTAGTHFADDRGRILIGGEYARDKGIGDLQPRDVSRPWAGRDRVSNAAFATNRLPGVLYSGDVRRADTSAGGLVTAGPLRGLNFNADGTTSPFGYGTVFGNNMIGGTSNYAETTTPGSDLRYPLERGTLLAHGEYDLTSGITGFLEGSYEHSLSAGETNAIRFQGSVTAAPAACTGTTAPSALGGILVNINNPYLPAAVRTRMQGAGVTCITVGRTFRDIGSLKFNDGTDDAWRGVAGLKGKFGDTFQWNAYYQYGKSSSQQLRIGNLNMAAFRQAIDTVTSPSGQIVCRSTLTNPSDGCVPLNIFGDGSATPAAAAFVTGTSSLYTDIKQQVAAATLSGQPVNTWAGPVGFAVGAEYRKESIRAVADARSEATGWQTGNRRGFNGQVNVKEVFGELNVPLISDQSWTKSLSLNGAVRYTDYSSSGGVTTWKLGGTWEPIGGVLLRATRSRDIRAGNLGELFTATSTATTSGIINRLTGDSSPLLVVTTGNRTLSPERANTWTAGVTYSPVWLRGLRMSIDYYDIQIDGAIGTLTSQQIVDRCQLDKLTSFCSLIATDSAGRITQITTTQLNLNRFHADGVDFEASYATDLGRIPGRLSLRGLATYLRRLATTASINATVTDPAGQYTTPHWTALGTVTYEVAGFRALADLRWYGPGTIDNTLTEGALSTVGVNTNHVGATFYMNGTLSYAFGEDRKREIFLRVNNILNRAPPYPSNGGGIFDEVGRAYRVGFRMGF